MNDALQNVGATASQSGEAPLASPDVTKFILLGFKIELMKYVGYGTYIREGITDTLQATRQSRAEREHGSTKSASGGTKE